MDTLISSRLSKKLKPLSSFPKFDQASKAAALNPRMPLSKKTGLVLILVSFLLAWAIANVGVEYQKLEMAAIANLFVPPICGLSSLILFAIIDYFFKKPRTIVVILLVLFNLFVGISIRWETAVISSHN